MTVAWALDIARFTATRHSDFHHMQGYHRTYPRRNGRRNDR